MENIFETIAAEYIKDSNRKLDPEIKTKWLAALTSGKYKQGTGFLHAFKEDSYCCLGVLCDINREKLMSNTFELFVNVELEQFLSKADTLDTLEISCTSGTGVLTDNLAREFGLTDIQGTLAGLNDEGYSFEQIASVIEKYL